MLRILIVVAASLAATLAHAAEDAAAKAEKLLNAMGGAEAWKNVRTVHNKAVNHHPQARIAYIQEYWYNTHEPSHYTTLQNFDIDRARAYTLDGGWSLTETSLTPFSEERLQSEIQSWSRSLYRKFYLMARNDPGLEVRLGEGGRLEFLYEGDFIGWMLIDENGAPTRHGGTPATDSFTDFDPPVAFGPINWPRGGRDESGWDFEMLSLRVSSGPIPKDFSMPEAPQGE